MFYGWRIAAAGAGTNAVILGITTFGFGVFLEEFRLTYGWGMTALALGLSIRSLELGLLAPVAGFILDRFGARRMAVAGVIIIAASLLLFWQARTLPMYYAASIVMALGQSFAGSSSFTVALMRWFVRKRGQAMSIVTTGNGFGYFATAIFALMIASLGFHETFAVLAVVVLVAGVPLALVIRDRPEDLGMLPDGEALQPGKDGAGAHAARAAGGMQTRDALRTPAFYLLVVALAAGAGAQLVWIVFQVPHFVAAGFSVEFVGIQAAVYGMAAIPLRWLVGWLGDRFGSKTVYLVALLLEALGLCFFAYVTPERWWLLIPFYLTFGIGHSGWLVLFQTLPADFFGTRNFATIRGLTNALQVPVSILIPLLMGFVFDTRGNYELAYVVVAGFVAIGALCLALIRRPMWLATDAAPKA